MIANLHNILHDIYNLWGFNTPIFLYLNHLTNNYQIVYILKPFSTLFSIKRFPIFYLIVLVSAHLNLKSKQNLDENIPKLFEKYFKLLTQIALCYIVFVIIYALMKFSINMPRPYCSLNNSDFFTIIDTSDERCLSSFPSAHTAFCFLVIYFIWPYLNNYMRYFAIFTPLIVGLSRISLAMHYPSDIIASLLISPIYIKAAEFLYEYFLLKCSITKNILMSLKIYLYQLHLRASSRK